MSTDIVRGILQGRVHIVMRNVHDPKQKLEFGSNLVVNKLYQQVAYLMGGSITNRAITQIAFGRGTSAPAATDTSITPLVTPASISVTPTYPTISSVLFTGVWGSAEQRFEDITEVGLLSTDNTLVARYRFGASAPSYGRMQKTPGWEWTIEWALNYTI